MRRIYTVTVSFEYAVLADSESDAESYVDDVFRDQTHTDLDMDTRLMRDYKGRYVMPDGWDGRSLIYGTDEDLTLGDAIEAEKGEIEGGPA